MATVTRIVASGTPRAAAAARRRPCRAGPAVAVSRGVSVGLPGPAGMALMRSSASYGRGGRVYFAITGQRQRAPVPGGKPVRAPMPPDRADARAGEEHHAERDGHQPGDDEHRARAGRPPALEPGEDLGEAADQRPG